MNEENNKKKTTIIIASVLLLVTVVIGVSYAYFSARSTSTSKTVTSGTLAITYTDGNLINASNIAPINYYKEYRINENGVTALCGVSEANAAKKDCWGEPTEYKFTVKNTGNIKTFYDISLNIEEISEEFKNYDLKWNLSLSANPTLYGGNFTSANTNENMYLLQNKPLNANVIESWTLEIWINDINKEQNELMGKTLKAKIQVDAKTKETNTLANYIENKVAVVQWTDQDGLYNPSTNVEGLWGTDNPWTTMDIDNISYTWFTDDSIGSSYFYRGYNVDNYVQFTDLKYTNDRYKLKNEYQPVDYLDCKNGSLDIDPSECDNVMSDKVKSVGDQLLWRIVRINSDGSIVLMTDDIIGETTYGSNTTYSGSTVETFVNNWYNNNIKNTEYHNMVKLNTFCNDTTSFLGDDYGYRITYPTNRCEDNMNRVTSYVGLLTEDEVIFSGVNFNSGYFDSYISNFEQGFIFDKYLWTMTNSGNNGSKTYIYEYGSDYIPNSIQVTSMGSVQPVIVLKNTVLYKGGTGKIDDPYKIK